MSKPDPKSPPPPKVVVTDLDEDQDSPTPRGNRYRIPAALKVDENRPQIPRRREGGNPKNFVQEQNLRPMHGSKNFQIHWAEFIHRVKVHELLMCLEAEQRKLKILREHTDVNDLLLGEGQYTFDKDDEENMMFMQSLEEEKTQAQLLADDIRAAESDLDYVSKSALKLFKTKLDITDEQFNLILELCRDRMEQKQLRDAFLEKKNREKYLHNASELRRMLYEFLTSTVFNSLMLALITTSTILIILTTWETVFIRAAWILQMLDALIIAVFCVEAGCKISIYKDDYFRNMWNILDLIIICTHFVEVFVDLITKMLALNADINKYIIFKLLKSLRSFRILRAIKFLPSLQVIVSTIFTSMLSMGSIAVLMTLFIFVWAVMGRGLFAEEDPIHFRNIWAAILTLFQLLTLDDWFDLQDAADNYVGMFFYLFSYIVIEYFVFLNLFVAVLVDNFQLALEESNFGTPATGQIDFTDPAALGLDSYADDVDTEETKDGPSQYNFVKDHKHGMDLNVEDYFPLDKESEEAKLISENMKLLASLDFEHFIWVRRMRLLANVLDAATSTKQNTWNVHDDGGDFGIEDDRHTEMHESFKHKESIDVD